MARAMVVFPAPEGEERMIGNGFIDGYPRRRPLGRSFEVDQCARLRRPHQLPLPRAARSLEVLHLFADALEVLLDREHFGDDRAVIPLAAGRIRLAEHLLEKEAEPLADSVGWRAGE